MTELPSPVNREQTFLAAIADRLDQQNALLVEIRDRLPSPQGAQPATVPAGAREVEITEPAAPATPATPQEDAEPLSEPAVPVKRPAAKKPQAKKPPARSAAPKKGT